jgi:ribosomal protein S12 methylthiotransferase
VRFLYCYPNRITQQLLDTIAGHEALVKYIDVPLQHASGPMLKRMKRGSNGDFFLKLIERIRKTIPGVAIRTSMIVGFPGETQADFEELCAFVKAARFDRLGVFSYSDEETSASFHLDGKVDARTIYNRKRRLMSLQRKISLAANRKLVGREATVLVEGPSARPTCCGKRGWRRKPPKLTACATSTTSAMSRRNPVRCVACASRGARLRPGGRVDRPPPDSRTD